MQFLVHMELKLPAIWDTFDLKNYYAAEAKSAEPYLRSGMMARVMREPATRNHWAVWDVADVQTIHDAYTGFPMFPWMTVTVIPVCVNPNDPGYPAQARPDLKMTWSCLNDYYNSQQGTPPGEAGKAHLEGKSVVLDDSDPDAVVSIHKHPEGPEPDELHFMVGDVKVAELGPDRNTHGEIKAPGYVDFLVKWDGAPIRWMQWKARLEQDNDTLHPDYETALKGVRKAWF